MKCKKPNSETKWVFFEEKNDVLDNFWKKNKATNAIKSIYKEKMSKLYLTD